MATTLSAMRRKCLGSDRIKAGDKVLSTQLISAAFIDWKKINEESYLRNIDAISSIDHIAFTHAVTFFVGENGNALPTAPADIAYGDRPVRERGISIYYCDALPYPAWSAGCRDLKL